MSSADVAQGRTTRPWAERGREEVWKLEETRWESVAWEAGGRVEGAAGWLGRSGSRARLRAGVAQLKWDPALPVACFSAAMSRPPARVQL